MMPRRFHLKQRSAGVLLHPTSLPGRHGSGDLGLWAYRFIDFLAAARQHWWQMLPIEPIGAGHSPYSATSAFGGNPLLICLDRLVEDDLLDRADVPALSTTRPDKVPFPAVIRYRQKRLGKAHQTFVADASALQRRAFEQFCQAQSGWLDDYAVFAAAKRVYGDKAWLDWPDDLRLRRARGLASFSREHAGLIDFAKFTQYLFERQWVDLKSYAEQANVGLVGDIPIFVSHDSADVWAHCDLFQLDRRGRAKVVSGYPPDALAKTGQLWGHPLYDWKQHGRQRFSWWIDRFRNASRRFHASRIDHFLGFHRCWTIPARARTAASGVWTPSPGRKLFSTVARKLGRLEIVAEDLGLVTPEAAALREATGFPGMRVLQQAFGDGARYDQPHNWPRDCVAYCGTHDTNTTVGWFKSLPRSGDRRRGGDGLLDRERALRYLGTDGTQIHWEMTQLLYGSVANTVIVPMQDLLGRDERARMNVPGKPTGNWGWRMKRESLSANLADRMADLVDTYERGVALP
jgi:4-alpha-glucanotransferase